MSQTFSKKERLLKRPDFLRLSAAGNKFHTAHFIFVWSRGASVITRLGVTVSRKVGNAVVRNRIKRALREYYRLHKMLFFCADFNLIAKKGAEKLDVQDIRLELETALQQITSRMKC